MIGTSHIQHLIHDGRLTLETPILHPQQFGQHGILLHIQGIFDLPNSPYYGQVDPQRPDRRAEPIDPTVRDTRYHHLDANEEFVLQPGRTIGVFSNEDLGIPPEIRGEVVHLAARLANGIALTAAPIPGGHHGDIEATITNQGYAAVSLRWGMAYGELVLYAVEGRDLPYQAPT